MKSKIGIKQQIQTASTIEEVKSLLATARSYRDMPPNRLRLCEREAEKRIQKLEGEL